MSVADQAEQVRKVKKFENGIVKDPITVHPNLSVKELLELMEKHHISGFPVVNGEKLLGLVTSRDIRLKAI